VAVRAFPPVDLADEYGLLAVGGDLEVSSLLLAYESGIFPWPLPGEDRIPWFAPQKRALLFLDELHVSRSLRKVIKQRRFEVRFDQNFRQVIEECSSDKNRSNQAGTWISKQIIDAYCELHRQGYAHSIECYENNKLVGGLYGVVIGGVFTGESMFYRTPNASKVALYFLATYLKNQGVTWIDCQIMNPHLSSLGAREVSRAKFMELLNAGTSRPKLNFSNQAPSSLA